MFNPQLFDGGDGDILDIAPIPYGLKQGVGETQHQHILNRFFCQVMIDPENLVFSEIPVKALIQIPGCFQIRTERFFHDNS